MGGEVGEDVGDGGDISAGLAGRLPVGAAVQVRDVQAETREEERGGSREEREATDSETAKRGSEWGRWGRSRRRWEEMVEGRRASPSGGGGRRCRSEGG